MNITDVTQILSFKKRTAALEFFFFSLELFVETFTLVTLFWLNTRLGEREDPDLLVFAINPSLNLRLYLPLPY